MIRCLEGLCSESAPQRVLVQVIATSSAFTTLHFEIDESEYCYEGPQNKFLELGHFEFPLLSEQILSLDSSHSSM